jgi:hypothetical protein
MDPMTATDNIKLNRIIFVALGEKWMQQTGLSSKEHAERCRRLLSTDAPTSADWIDAALRLLDGEYPRGEQVKPAASWHASRTRGIHAALLEAVRLYGLGVSKRAVHADFWRFCFTVAGFVPQELEHEETQQLVAMWVDARRPATATP